MRRASHDVRGPTQPRRSKIGRSALRTRGRSPAVQPRPARALCRYAYPRIVRGHMARLSRADMETALALAAELTEAAPQRERADAWLLERISRACHSEVVVYSHHGESSRVLLHDVEYPAVPGGEPWAPTDDQWD